MCWNFHGHSISSWKVIKSWKFEKLVKFYWPHAMFAPQNQFSNIQDFGCVAVGGIPDTWDSCLKELKWPSLHSTSVSLVHDALLYYASTNFHFIQQAFPIFYYQHTISSTITFYSLYKCESLPKLFFVGMSFIAHHILQLSNHLAFHSALHCSLVVYFKYVLTFMIISIVTKNVQ